MPSFGRSSRTMGPIGLDQQFTTRASCSICLRFDRGFASPSVMYPDSHPGSCVRFGMARSSTVWEGNHAEDHSVPVVR